jgi:beta-lactam-binding protein with PASTA domain
VTGPTEDEARRIAEDAGFEVRVEETNAPTAEEVGEVVLQRPDAGTRAPEGSELTLFVGR